MLPDFSEYNWVIPDFVWELSEQIDLGEFFLGVWKFNFKKFVQLVRHKVKVVNFSSLYSCI